jgi:hypothetical protein
MFEEELLKLCLEYEQETKQSPHLPDIIYWLKNRKIRRENLENYDKRG